MKVKEKNVYEDIARNDHFQNLLQQLPKEERAQIERSLKELCDNFTANVLEPLGRLQD